jgi:hypothetical protein
MVGRVQISVNSNVFTPPLSGLDLNAELDVTILAAYYPQKIIPPPARSTT